MEISVFWRYLHISEIKLFKNKEIGKKNRKWVLKMLQISIIHRHLYFKTEISAK